MRETITLDNVDVTLLKEQRDTLVNMLGFGDLYPDEENSLQGIVNLLDQMLDNSSDNTKENEKVE